MKFFFESKFLKRINYFPHQFESYKRSYLYVIQIILSPQSSHEEELVDDNLEEVSFLITEDTLATVTKENYMLNIGNIHVL